MKFLTSAAVAAMILGAPALTSDLALFDGAAHAGNHSQKAKNDKGAEKSAAAKSKGAEKSAGKRSVNADLKGVNSLNRSLNGLMNSKDAKMDGFRAFIVASAEYEEAKDVLEAAQEAYTPLAQSYSDLLAPLGYSLPNNPTDWDTLKGDLETIAASPEPVEDDYLVETEVEGEVEGEVEIVLVLDEEAYNQAVTEWSNAVGDANAALADYDATRAAWMDYAVAYNDALAKEAAASEDAMIAAIVDALNATGAGPVTADDVSDDMVAWVAARLGAGDDLEGLIDEYIATQG